MNIDYIIISSNDNPLYYDFHDIVIEQWCKLGFKVFFAHITDIDSDIINTNYGLYKKFKSVNNIDSGFQSQVVRMYIPTLLPNKNFLISDIDMLPLNKQYFLDRSDNIPDDRILIYSGQPYDNVPYYPMCYILAKGEIFKNDLNINMNYNDFIIKMSKYSNLDWNTDEKYFYQTTLSSENLIILRDRNFKMRLDRGNWYYDQKKLMDGYYIDSHLLRPYNQYKNEIDKILIKK